MLLPYLLNLGKVVIPGGGPDDEPNFDQSWADRRDPRKKRREREEAERALRIELGILPKPIADIVESALSGKISADSLEKEIRAELAREESDYLAGQALKAKSVAEHLAFESAKAAIEGVRITALRLIEDARINSAIIAAEIAAQVESALAFKLAAESAVRLAAENKLKLQRQEEEDFIFLVAMAMQSELA